jgi:hypothetical protein
LGVLEQDQSLLDKQSHLWTSHCFVLCLDGQILLWCGDFKVFSLSQWAIGSCLALQKTKIHFVLLSHQMKSQAVTWQWIYSLISPKDHNILEFHQGFMIISKTFHKHTFHFGVIFIVECILQLNPILQV